MLKTLPLPSKTYPGMNFDNYKDFDYGQLFVKNDIKNLQQDFEKLTKDHDTLSYNWGHFDYDTDT